MINPQAQWRIDLARRLARRISTFEGVQAIVIAGSVARDYADPYSDLELPIFWDELPTDDQRQAIVATLQADFLYGYDGPSQEDQLLINGFQVDLWHCAVTHEDSVIDAVLHNYSTDLSDSNFMDTVRACIPLYGEAIIQRWKAQAQAYPDELAIRNIQEHLSSFTVHELSLHADRDNPTAFYAELSHLQEEIFFVLLALNRAYFPTFKWLYPILESMQVKPQNVTQRFRQAFKLPYPEAVADMAHMLQEVIDLIERHFPQVDTAGARRKLAVTRPAYEIKDVTSFEGTA